MKYGLSIDDSVVFGFKGQFEFVQKYHWIVQRYLDEHPESHKDLLYPDGSCRYYDVLKKALTTEEWKEFMKPQPWEKIDPPACKCGCYKPLDELTDPAALSGYDDAPR